jgi:hypothetical protein
MALTEQLMQKEARSTDYHARDSWSHGPFNQLDIIVYASPACLHPGN